MHRFSHPRGAIDRGLLGDGESCDGSVTPCPFADCQTMLQPLLDSLHNW